MSASENARPIRSKRRPGRRIAFLQSATENAAPLSESSPLNFEPSTSTFTPHMPYKQSGAARRKRLREPEGCASLPVPAPKRPRGRPARGATVSYQEDSPPCSPLAFSPEPRPQLQPKRKRGRPRKNVSNGSSERAKVVAKTNLSTSFVVPEHPVLRLWDNQTRAVAPCLVSVDKLGQTLEYDRALSVYVGQDARDFPDCLERELLSTRQLCAWKDEWSIRGDLQRVMMFDPALRKILHPTLCPNARNLEHFLTTAEKQDGQLKMARVYAAQHTMLDGVSKGAREVVERAARSFYIAADNAASDSSRGREIERRGHHSKTDERLAVSSGYSLRARLDESAFAQYFAEDPQDDVIATLSTASDLHSRTGYVGNMTQRSEPDLVVSDEEGGGFARENDADVLLEVFGSPEASSPVPIEAADSAEQRLCSIQSLPEPWSVELESYLRGQVAAREEAILGEEVGEFGVAREKLPRFQIDENSGSASADAFEQLLCESRVSIDRNNGFDEDDVGSARHDPSAAPPCSVQAASIRSRDLEAQTLSEHKNAGLSNVDESVGALFDKRLHSPCHEASSLASGDGRNASENASNLKRDEAGASAVCEVVPSDVIKPSKRARRCTYVYLWSKLTSRSDNMYTIEDAVATCLRMGKGLQIYCGQDYDFVKEGHSLLPGVKEFALALSKRSHSKRVDDRIRIFDRAQKILRPYHLSPSTAAFLEWQRENPDFLVFLPPMLEPSHTARRDHITAKRIFLDLKAFGSKLYQLVVRYVIPQIRKMRVTKMGDNALLDSVFWNAIESSRYKTPSFRTRSEAVAFCLKNPWVEIHREQEIIEDMHQNTEFRLIPVLTTCPARLACFWDRVSKIKYLQPKEGSRFFGKTIFECLSGDDSLELYVGQDTPYFGAVSRTVAGYAEANLFPYRYMLACCGRSLHDILRQSDLVAVHINELEYSTRCAMFWKPEKKSTIMQPCMLLCKSIHAYAEEKAGSEEIYIGQDMPIEAQTQLSCWFEVLTYQPGFCKTTDRAIVTKRSFLPFVKPVRSEFCMPKRNIVLDGENSPPGEDCGQGETSRHGKVAPLELFPARCVESTRARDDHLDSPTSLTRTQKAEFGDLTNRAETCEAIEKPHLPAVQLSPDRGSLDPSQNTTKCSEEVARNTLHEWRSPSPEDTAAFDSSEVAGNVLDDVMLDKQDNEALGFGALPSGNCSDISLVKALERSTNASLAMREAGPKILKRELKHDLREELREALILLVPSSQQLCYLARRFRSSDFVNAAAALCLRLEALDVLKCFEGGIGCEYGPPALTEVRESLEAGHFYTTNDIVRGFRSVCADLKQFHEGSMLHNEAVMLTVYGEKVISDFYADNYTLMREEMRILRISTICEKALTIGFRESTKRCRARNTSKARSPGNSKPVIHVSGHQSEVTFLNYRDEKGHSVMGKRHSARVLGLSLDTGVAERRAGNVKPCHVCEVEVRKSDGDVLRCANRAVDLCDKMVCRKCLEAVFKMTESDFVLKRQEDDWICFHCRGLCLSRTTSSEAKEKSCVDERAVVRESVVVFVWPADMCETSTLRLLCARRSVSGVFDEWKDAKRVALSRDASELSWSATISLQLGLYRFRLEADGAWFASTVVKVRCGGLREAEREGGPFPIGSDRPMRRSIGWRISKKEEVGPIHSFSRLEGGTLVQRCARTEGYDWRRSKRHSVVQWMPELGIDDSEESSCKTCDGDAVMKLRPCVSASYESCQRKGFPKLRLGQFHVDFLNDVAAFKFDHMMSQTFWGIIAGKSKIHGIGLFTLTGYQKGDFVIEYAGDLIRMCVADRREERYDAAGLGTYFFRIDDNKIVDATVKSNRARFTNHSCDPNMAADIVNVRGRDLVVLLATRKIAPYSELTFNYQLPFEDKKLQCLCGSWNCVGVMN